MDQHNNDLSQPPILPVERIVLRGLAQDQEKAFSEVTRLLLTSHAIDAAYIDSMRERERLASTYMSSGLVILHALPAVFAQAHFCAMSFIRYPHGIDWNGQRAFFVSALAAHQGEHLQMLQHLAHVFLHENNVRLLHAAQNTKELHRILTPQ